SQAGSEKIAFFQYPGEHWESGDAHCGPHEESERRKSHPRTGKLRIERGRQSYAQEKRKHDAEIADQHNCRALFEDAFEINLKADHKHKEQKTKLTQDCERAYRCWRKNICRRSGKEPPQKRWSKGNSGRHFADDTGLTDALEDPAQRARRQQNDRDRKY
ncbi:MAG: hypothetical protein ABSF93_03645, partial [Candidatus Sulfotelmatobacter sp.]